MKPKTALKGLICALLSSCPFAVAQDAEMDAPEAKTTINTRALDEVTIIAHRREASEVPGSAHVIEPEELSIHLHSDVMRVLRSVPGVYLQEEDGFGLRPNIGIRGSGLDRSARVAILEDGVLIAPAPYAAPSAYYFPTQRRMYSVEVLKGPSSIAVGPRTTGGAVNLISTPIPAEFAGFADLRVGGHNSLDAHAYVGDRGPRFSWLVETVQAASDGFKAIDGPAGINTGQTGFDIDDYVVKLQFDSDPASALYQSLRLKAGYTDQVSDETYLGLTEDDFKLNPYRRYAASAGDRFSGEHEQLQATYVLENETGWRAEVTAYRNNFARNWFKLQSVNGAGIGSVLDDPVNFATEYAYLTGGASPDDAIVKRHNNRTYYAHGVQARLSRALRWGDAEINLSGGFRVHEDEEDRLQKEDGFRMEDGMLVLTSVGAPGSQANRISRADAVSYFVDAEMRAGNWTVTPGARFEDIDMVRYDFSTSDPSRGAGATRVRANTVSTLIPGVGVLYALNDRWRVLGGVHRGFNPPAPGSSAGEEESTNIELGMRYVGERASLDAVWFRNDYDNLVGTVTASTGGSGEIGDQFDGGEVTVEGLELSAGLDRTWGDLTVPLRLQYTWTAKAEFGSAFESEFDPWGDVAIGDELPYVPEHQLQANVGLASAAWGVNLAANYVGRMRATAGQGALPSETIESRVVWDLVARWQWSDSWTTYLKVDNLFDETYVAARRPAGLRPGLERMAYLGVTFEL